jgi:thymidylate synthase (FAD)
MFKRLFSLSRNNIFIKKKISAGVGSIQLIDIMPHPKSWSCSELKADEAVIKAARMSTTQDLKSYDNDIKLLNYLIKNEHSSPFEMVQYSLYVKIPMFVKMHLIRHRDYFYDLEGSNNEYYYPEKFRKQDKKNKQSSGENFNNKHVEIIFNKIIEKHKTLKVDDKIKYKINPMLMFTDMIWSTNLRSLLNFIRLRLHKSAQYETQQLALSCWNLLTSTCPNTAAIIEESLNNEEYPLLFVQKKFNEF